VGGLLVIVMLASGCGRFGFHEIPSEDGGSGELLRDGRAEVDGGTVTCSAWSQPVAFPNVNSSADDWDEALSPDQTVLVFGRPSSGGHNQLLVSTSQGGGVFSSPVAIAVLTAGAGRESGPTWSHDGTQLYFVSDRASLDNYRLYVSNYAGGVFGTPQLVADLAGQYVSAPTLSSDGLEMFYGAGNTVNRATRANSSSPWVVDGVVVELSSGKGDGYPSLSPDGLSLYFETGRDNATDTIYGAVRPQLSGPFGPPMPVTEINTGGAEGDPSFVGSTLLVFSAVRSGGIGGFDIYTATRTCN